MKIAGVCLVILLSGLNVFMGTQIYHSVAPVNTQVQVERETSEIQSLAKTFDIDEELARTIYGIDIFET